MAPGTDFFKAPGALNDVRASIKAWVGTRDEITPPTQAEFVRQALDGLTSVDLRILPEASHFSFMNAPPPYTTEVLADRDAFLASLAEDAANFVKMTPGVHLGFKAQLPQADVR